MGGFAAPLRGVMNTDSASRGKEIGSGESPRKICRRGRNYWAPEIKRAVKAGGNFDIGIIVHHARIECAHGEWMILWESEDSIFGIGKAEKVDRVGECLGWVNSSDRESFPTALGRSEEHTSELQS